MAKKSKAKGKGKAGESRRPSGCCGEFKVASSMSALAAARRQAIVGDGADSVQSTCPIDAMIARGIISTEHAQACEWFLRLYRYRNGSGSVKGALDDGTVEIPSVGERERRDLEWFAILDSRGFSSEDMANVVNLVVFSRYPLWLQHVIENGCSLRYSDDAGWNVTFASDAQRQAAIDRTMAERKRDVGVLDRLRDVWVSIGRVSDDRLRQMSRQGRAQLDRAAGAAPVSRKFSDLTNDFSAERRGRVDAAKALLRQGME